MQLLAALAVPLALGIATYTFNMQQAQAQQDQQQEAALQSYLDHMSDLLLGNNTGKDSPSLAYATYNSEISQVARSRTLTILRSLDGRRKGLVLQFLYEAELIGFLESPMADIPASPVIILIGADLSGADLSEVNLRGAVLAEVNLEGADLSGADLSKVDLSNSDLRWANLSDSFISQEQLDKTYCQGATLPKQLTCANKTPPSTKFPLRSRG